MNFVFVFEDRPTYRSSLHYKTLRIDLFTIVFFNFEEEKNELVLHYFYESPQPPLPLLALENIGGYVLVQVSAEIKNIGGSYHKSYFVLN